jgi:hypothetical protein
VRSTRATFTTALALTAALALGACGSGHDDLGPAPAASPTTSSATPAASPTTAPTTAAGAATTPSSVDLDALSHQLDAVRDDLAAADSSLTQASDGIASSEPIPG